MTRTAPAVPAPEPFSLRGSHRELSTRAAELARELAPRAREIRTHLLERGEHHPELWSRFAGNGWAGLSIAGEHGAEGGLLGLALVLEAFAEQGIILWMPVLSAAIAHAIATVGSEELERRWLGLIAAGEVSLALAATEPECGHNLFRVRTTITPKPGGGFVVNGLKAVTSGLDLAERVLVFGRAPREQAESGSAAARFTAVLVDPRAPGATATELPMRGREGVKQFQLELQEVEVGEEDLVGAEGQGLLALWPFTHVERILTAALCVGSARHCIARAAERARSRQIFGAQPIGAEQSIQHPLASLHARAEAISLFVHRTASRFDAGIDGFVLAGEANMAKVLTGELVFDAADHAVQTLGAQAWDEREGMIDAFLDARLARSGPISQELALNFIAQHVLGLPTHR
jgi:acyl-CoA dehydrogenase